MNVTEWSQAEFERAYGVHCAALPLLQERDGLCPTFCRIPPQGTTAPHAHFEPELFYLIEGQGRMTVGEETRDVRAGMLVRIPPGARHALQCTGSEELVFLSVYSEDFEVPRLPASAVITAAPPTPNGPLHLGHLSGPYLAADVMARYLRMRSVDVLTHTGSDDHQNYVAARARALGEPTESFRKRMRSRILAGLDAFDIEFDELIEPKHDDVYHARVQAFAERAMASGMVRPREVPLPHCDGCEQALVDAWVEGLCPGCSEPGRGGCEACGLVVGPHELLHPRCTTCARPATLRSTQVWTFRLSEHLEALRGELSELGLPPRLRGLVERVAARPDLEVLVSHPDRDNEGLRLPGSSQALHVWFEMAAHYERFALSPRPWIHCFGFDNAFHYLLFIPALLRAMNGPRARLPYAVLANEFLLLDGEKFSTSRGHAIWADEVEDAAGPLRLQLALQRPAPEPASFSMARFRCFSEELTEQLSALRARAHGGTEGTLSASVELDCHRFTRDMERLLSPRGFDLRRASRRLVAFIDHVRNHHGPPREETLLLRTLSTFLALFMPREARALQASLGHEDRP